MKTKNFFQRNLVYITIVVLVALTAYISGKINYIGINPFNSYTLENPVQAVCTDNCNIYVVDSATFLAVTNKDNELIYTIEGNNENVTFDTANEVTGNANGDVFVIDKSFDASGTAAYRERVIKFTNNGKNREILYDIYTCNEDGEQIIYLESPRIINDELYFTYLDETGVKVLKAGSSGVSTAAFMPLDNAYDIAADTSFSNDFKISVVLMNGDIITYSGDKAEVIYNARSYDTEEYPSLISEIAYDENGNLYANDLGMREIYSVSENGIDRVLGRGGAAGVPREVFGHNPIYTGLNVSNGVISVLSTEYEYDNLTEESEYYYYILSLDYEGNILSNIDSVELSVNLKASVIVLYACIALFLAIAVFSLVKIVVMMRQTELTGGGTPVIILLIAIVITVSVSYSVFDVCNVRYADESAANLSNIAYLLEATIDKNILENIDSPDAYFEEDYREFDNQIQSIMKSETNKGKNVYTTIYKVTNNIICEVYLSDFYHGVMYPMAGVYENSIEQNVIDNNEIYLSYDYALSEGSYTFVLIPVYNNNGEAIGLIETGTDHNAQTQENSALYKNLLLLASMAVIIAMLMFSEIANGFAAFKNKAKSNAGKTVSANIIRPVAFMVFFTANITTTFLPIYGMSLWNEAFPLPAEVAAALPLSVEFVTSAISALMCGNVIRKLGLKFTTVLGAMFYIAGNVLSAFAGNLWILICANGTCGIGGGLLTISVNTWVTGLDTEEKQNEGFVHVNAAFFAGMNCGTVIGSIINDNFGTYAAYFTAATCAVIIAVFAVILVGGLKISSENKTAEPKVSLRKFITPRVIRYFILIVIPYWICGSFLNYYFPIAAEKNDLTASEISMAFLISGVISIYAGTSLGTIVTEKMGVKRSMILASFIYAAALMYLIINPSVSSCYVVIVLFAAADSFGLSAHSVYFAALPEFKTVGESRALGISSTIESVTSACGSVIFGAALLAGERRGIAAIAAIFALLLVLYIVGGVRDEKGDESVN